MTMRGRKVLLIEDEPAVVKRLAEALRFRGCEVRKMFALPRDLREVATANPDVIVLDLKFQQDEEEGLDFLRLLKDDPALRPIPVVVYATTSIEGSMVWRRALRYGAYIPVSKGAGIDALEDAIAAALSRAEGPRHAPRQRRLYPIDYDPATATVYRDGVPAQLALRPQSRQLLEYLLLNRGQVLTPEQIAAQVLGDEDASSDAVHRAVSRLRDSLGDTRPYRYIQTVNGQGYRLPVEREEPLD